MTSISSTLRFHHVALSVRDLEKSLAFYEQFGFRLCFQWTSKDESLVIAHCVLGGAVLELFAYESNRSEVESSTSIGGDLETVGVKHFAVNVDDLGAAYELVVANGWDATEITHGRTKVDYFFVRDPDGIWIEVVSDTRLYDPENPVLIYEGE